jgi:RecG-like helicase
MSKKLKPWERQPEETDKSWNAFVIYRDMPLETRTVRATMKSLGKHESKGMEWQSKYLWTARARAWDAEVDRINRLAQVKAVEKMRERQIKQALKMQEIGKNELLKIAEKQLKAKKALEPKIVLQLIKDGTALERLVRGEPGEITHSTIKEEIDYGKLTTEQLKALKQIQKDLRAKEE